MRYPMAADYAANVALSVTRSLELLLSGTTLLLSGAAHVSGGYLRRSGA